MASTLLSETDRGDVAGRLATIDPCGRPRHLHLAPELAGDARRLRVTP